jgi:hypothetical protein
VKNARLATKNHAVTPAITRLTSTAQVNREPTTLKRMFNVRIKLYARKGAEAPCEFYRLSAVCQPTVEILVAGARNHLDLEFAWAA